MEKYLTISKRKNFTIFYNFLNFHEIYSKRLIVAQFEWVKMREYDLTKIKADFIGLIGNLGFWLAATRRLHFKYSRSDQRESCIYIYLLSLNIFFLNRYNNKTIQLTNFFQLWGISILIFNQQERLFVNKKQLIKNALSV